MNVKMFAMVLTTLALVATTAIAIMPAFPPSSTQLKGRTDRFFLTTFIKGRLMAITGVGDITYQGDTFQHTFTLTNLDTVVLPEMDDSDGIVTRLYKTHKMFDQAGNVVQEGDFEEITTPLASGTTTDYPISLEVLTGTPSGDYASTAVLFKISQTWNRVDNTWTLGDAVEVDKQGVTFNVQTPTPPPVPGASALLAKISAFFASIVAWITSLFT